MTSLAAVVCASDSGMVENWRGSQESDGVTGTNFLALRKNGSNHRSSGLRRFNTSAWEHDPFAHPFEPQRKPTSSYNEVHRSASTDIDNNQCPNREKLNFSPG